MYLTGGQEYYIEAWAKEAGGEDNLSVAWSGPGISRQLITGDYLSSPAVAGCDGWCPANDATPYRAQLISFANKCADVNSPSTSPGATVIDYTCNGGQNQGWTLASNGALQVYGSPARCLAPAGARIAADTGMTIAACDGSASQTFTYSALTGAIKLGSLCLEVPGASTNDVVQLAIDTCDSSAEQFWSFAAGSRYTPDAPVITSPKKATVAGTSCADCTVKIYKATGAAGAASTLLGTVTASATGAFSYSPGGAIVVGNVITATSTTPLGVVSGPAANVATVA